jgi:hypothetical protein
MKRVLLVLAVLAFALPAIADSIVYFDGKPSSYSIGVSRNGSGSLNYTGGQDLLTGGGHESLEEVRFPGTRDVGSNWSGGALYAPSGFSGDVTRVLSNAQTEMLTARYTRNGNGVQIINGHLHEVILSYAGGFQNAWKVTLVNGYITPHKHRPLAAPEPETLSLMGIGLVFIGGVVRRKL